MRKSRRDETSISADAREGQFLWPLSSQGRSGPRPRCGATRLQSPRSPGLHTRHEARLISRGRNSEIKSHRLTKKNERLGVEHNYIPADLAAFTPSPVTVVPATGQTGAQVLAHNGHLSWLAGHKQRIFLFGKYHTCHQPPDITISGLGSTSPRVITASVSIALLVLHEVLAEITAAREGGLSPPHRRHRPAQPRSYKLTK
ncbi:hypothetical protein E2C01_021134 [Portunus trituberculatus]|uniref:Uncharacterized protein n=1 Tax=Portunus trituberculatus TaxID=210409 RepID=A0A5B7E3U8_PORTR|nr:hypothetical protein [Portunus trituberculatus]